MMRMGWQRLTNQNRIPFAFALLILVLLVNFLVQPNLLEPGTLNGSMRVMLPLILSSHHAPFFQAANCCASDA